MTSDAIIAVPREHLDAMIAHALEDAPVECCGVVAARDGRVVAIHPARNTEASPYRFNIDPREYMKLEEAINEAGATVAGFYHSHTGSEARPSPTDIRMMGPFFGPPYVHFVIGVADRDRPHARVFTIEDSAATEHGFEVLDG
jgi:proteasome lid subunit RPN8/RPN11